jgi:hypothetical protein
MSKGDKDFNTINVRRTARFRRIILDKGVVTQATNINTAVTINKSAGIITTVNSTLEPNGNASFSVNNYEVKADSVVLGNIVNYNGTQGAPFARIQNVTSGSFTVALRNVDDTNALNGSLKFAYTVL